MLHQSFIRRLWFQTCQLTTIDLWYATDLPSIVEKVINSDILFGWRFIYFVSPNQTAENNIRVQQTEAYLNYAD